MDSLSYIAEPENLVARMNLPKVTKGKEVPMFRKNTLKTLKLTTGVQRSFGDISNRVGIAVPQKCDKNKKEKLGTKRKTSVPKAIKSGSLKFHSPFPGPEFRPEIKETEDYGDFLPESLKLSDNQMNQFVKFWNSGRKEDEDSCPPSPTHSLKLLPLIESHAALPPIELTPVEEDIDIYSLPPPLWVELE